MLRIVTWDGGKKARLTKESAKQAVKTIRVRECRVRPALTCGD
jgi:hypothetical protein